jgi:uncharacterized LabA/DUF88 family protein
MKRVTLQLRGKAAVFIDWANVHGWKKSLKRVVDLKKLYQLLSSYKEIKLISLYFGMDSHPKSKLFLQEVKQIGYHVVTKPVKYIPIAVVEGQRHYRRKCDFDMECCIDVHKLLEENYNSFIFFTGDGDFEPLYKLLVGRGKQVIVVYARGHLGREVWELKEGIFKVEIQRLG